MVTQYSCVRRYCRKTGAHHMWVYRSDRGSSPGHFLRVFPSLSNLLFLSFSVIMQLSRKC